MKWSCRHHIPVSIYKPNDYKTNIHQYLDNIAFIHTPFLANITASFTKEQCFYNSNHSAYC